MPPSCPDQTALELQHPARRLAKLMDQHAAAPAYETHLSQRLSAAADAHNLLAAQPKARRHFYIEAGGSATAMSSQGRSIIIKGQQRRRWRGESAVSEGVTKLGCVVIHLRPLASSPAPTLAAPPQPLLPYFLRLFIPQSLFFSTVRV